jgi:hypothetical protein
MMSPSTILKFAWPSAYVSSNEIATPYEHALKWLDAAYQDRDIGLMRLKLDFLLDPLPSDPCLTELVGKLGLPR